MEARAEEILAELGIEHIDPLALIEDLSLAERQIVEIVRAISHDPDVLLLDEPTSSLVEREVVWLFGRSGVCASARPASSSPRTAGTRSRPSPTGSRCSVAAATSGPSPRSTRTKPSC